MVKGKVRRGRTSGAIIGITTLIILLAGAADVWAFISVSTSLLDLYPQSTAEGAYYYNPIDSIYPRVTVTEPSPSEPSTTEPSPSEPSPSEPSTTEPSTTAPTPSGAGSISGMKFNDSNSNGIKDPGEIGLADWTIILTNSDGSNVTAITDESGHYTFSELPADEYTVSEVLQKGWNQTAPTPIPPGTYTVALLDGENVTGRDFGNAIVPPTTVPPTTVPAPPRVASVSGMKFNDSNGNGVRDAKEEGLSGWIITLTDLNGSNITAVTDESGYYIFSGLPAGNYTVGEILQPGWTQTAPRIGTYNISFNGVDVIDFTGKDFGNMIAIPPPTGSISGMKFNDSNANGIKDPGETGLADWTITLTNPDGSMENTTTNADGFYMFRNLSASNYNVSEVLQEGWNQTAPLRGAYSVNLLAGENVMGKDFGNIMVPPTTVPPTTVPPTTVPVPTPIPAYISYTVSVSTSPPGLSPQPTGGGIYDNGTTATVTMQPVTGYTFQGWTENGIQVSTNTSYSFTVEENQTLTADYISVPTPNTTIPYTVSVSTSPPGLNPQPTGGGSHYYGDTIVVTAQPVEGYKFQKWTENGKIVSINDSYRFTVASGRDLRAEYSEGGNASIVIEPGSGTPGSEITVKGTGFKISADKSQKVSIYFEDRVVKEGAIERDTSGSPGSFRTTFVAPSNIKPGHYKVIAKGLTDSADADFELIKTPVSGISELEQILVYIAAISSIIAAVVLLKYRQQSKQYARETKKQLPIRIETVGGIESTYYREYAINVEARGGAERS